jgi:putative aldouronate transport system substrate-binding protein
MADNARINTFIRKDWLDKLNLTAPTNIEEFHSVLTAFKDNAELLLGSDASRIIPFSFSYDVGWRADHLIGSFVPHDLSDKDAFIYGFDDRRFQFPNVKEAIRLLNTWYNEGLTWNDFALYDQNSLGSIEDDMIKAGFVGSFTMSWDQPFRDGENSMIANIKKLVGEEAEYIAIEPFPDDSGLYKKFLPAPTDRKVFLPATNKEPVASLLYVDWVTDPVNRTYLQIGEEGINHEVQPDGAIKLLAAEGQYVTNVIRNIDYTMTINGMYFVDADGNYDLAKTSASNALAFAGVDPAIVADAFYRTQHDGRIGKAVNVGEIESESGMGELLKSKRDVILAQSITAKPADFDSIWDAGYTDYLNSGAQAIIDERTAKWAEFFGDATQLP